MSVPLKQIKLFAGKAYNRQSAFKISGKNLARTPTAKFILNTHKH